jgi:hypothetical protein
MLHAATNPLAARPAGQMPRAKRVILLFMSGGPSQMDLFDPKPLIQKNHGRGVAAPLPEQHRHASTEKLLALGTEIPVRPRGQSGLTISDLLPHTAFCALCPPTTTSTGRLPCSFILGSSQRRGPRSVPGSATDSGPKTRTCRLSSPFTLESTRAITAPLSFQPLTRARL